MPVSYNLLPSRQTMPWNSFLLDRLFSPHPRIARIQTSFFRALRFSTFCRGLALSLYTLVPRYQCKSGKARKKRECPVPTSAFGI